MPDPIPYRSKPTLSARTQTASAAPAKKFGPTRGLGSARPLAYRHQPVPPLRWHARWPRPHPIAWAVFGCVVFWWAVICAVRF
jgi:hypothetical protein